MPLEEEKEEPDRLPRGGGRDVFGVAAAALAIVVLLLMLGSLFSWLRQDLAITFADLTDNITDAVIIGK